MRTNKAPDKKTNFLKYLLISLFMLCLTSSIWLAVDISTYANIRQETPSDVAVVLGAAVQGEQPSPVFRERINHAINLYQKGAVKFLIFTGGLGLDETLTESEVARNYAVEKEIPATAIYLDKLSETTYQNLIETQRILGENNLKTILIISDPLHMKRAMIMAKDIGLSASTAPTPSSLYKSWHTKASFLAREVYFLMGYYLSR